MGTIAKDRAESEQVKTFAERMGQDHLLAQDDVKSIARRKNIQLPLTLMPEHQQIVDRDVSTLR